MNRKNQLGSISPALAGAALVLASLTWSAVPPVRALPSTAQRFVRCLDAIDKSGQKLSLWDKVTYSLVLAGMDNSQAKHRS